MVKGLDLFREHFDSFKDQYILIGGAACDLLFEEYGAEFRATRDLDIVLCLETLDQKFANAFWTFVEAGGYEMRERNSGRPEFFRFQKPRNLNYPFMLELFSRKPDILSIPESQRVTPIPLGEESSSLSAILLNEDYYKMLRRGVKEVQGIPVVGPEYMILLKAYAFLDLSMRKKEGEQIDEKKIRKHKNDVFRIFTILDQDIPMVVPASVREDMRNFIECMASEHVDLAALGIRQMNKESIIDALAKFYGPRVHPRKL